MSQSLLTYILSLGDNSMILGQRLGEWCGHGPILEVDMALTNISLDLFGQARSYMQYAAEVEGKGRTEDDMASLRDAREFRNVLLVEQANGDFAHTMVRQFFFDAYHQLFLKALCDSADERLAAIAQKSLKEVNYHLRFSSEWTIRLGDGTEESHQRMQAAIDDLWPYTGELCTPTALDTEMAELGIGVDLVALKADYDQHVAKILTEATLSIPEGGWQQTGGKEGRHTEQLGFILTELQWMQRAYPGQKW